MKKIIAAIAGLMLVSTVQATPLILDFNSGITTSNTSYSEDGFTLSVDLVDNHFEDNYGGAAMGFHNGPTNRFSNNNLTLSYGGAAFDLLDIDLSYFYQDGEIELTGSDGSIFSSYELGVQSVSFFDVTSVSFSVIDYFDGQYGGAAWNNITVGIASPSNSIPEPTSVALLGLALAGFALSRKKKSS